MRLALLSPFLLSCLVAAQLPVSLTGRIEPATSPCNPAATHVVGCTEILLRGDGVDLGALEGRVVDITGVSEGTTACPLVAVTAAVAAPQSTSTFSLGNYRINTNLVFTTTAPVGAAVAYFFSCESGFLPLLTFGTLQLNPLTDFVYWGIDISIGVALRTVRIPNEPGLIGQRALFQTAFVTVTPTFEARLLNAGCFVIQ
ncbi:MAG: hypothetical protein R3F56_21880 [Planctomycetota bacterium]